MDETDHAVSARRHADQANGGSGPDPRVQATLAHTEALLAVAAAIDRLAEAIGGRDAAAPSAVPGSAYQVAEIRRQYPQAYLPWTEEADAALMSARQAGHDIGTLADTFGRQPSAIRSRLNHLGANAPAGPTQA